MAGERGQKLGEEIRTAVHGVTGLGEVIRGTVTSKLDGIFPDNVTDESRAKNAAITSKGYAEVEAAEKLFAEQKQQHQHHHHHSGLGQGSHQVGGGAAASHATTEGAATTTTAPGATSTIGQESGTTAAAAATTTTGSTFSGGSDAAATPAPSIDRSGLGQTTTSSSGGVGNYEAASQGDSLASQAKSSVQDAAATTTGLASAGVSAVTGAVTGTGTGTAAEAEGSSLSTSDRK